KPGFRLLEARPKKRSKAECGRHGCGNKKAKGKKKMVTISEKEAIFQKYQELKEMGVSNPLQKLKEQKLPGYFHGCLFESKWGRVRREQQWELLVQTAPKLCQKHKELPNSLRRILNFSTMKHGEPATAASQKNHLPLVLQDVIENVLMDRIDLGEELGIPFVKNTILWCVELWNECLTSVKQMMKKQSLSMLQERDGEFAEMDHSQFECVFQQMVHKADTLLQPIQLSETDGDGEILEHMRIQELEGERTYAWAIQNGDAIESRCILPQWISRVLELRLCQFVTEHDAWQERILKRVDKPNPLTRKQQARYEAWQANL
ncbi:Malate dehydrogenase 2, partial [Durusdinium trenchii]